MDKKLLRYVDNIRVVMTLKDGSTTSLDCAHQRC